MVIDGQTIPDFLKDMRHKLSRHGLSYFMVVVNPQTKAASSISEYNKHEENEASVAGNSVKTWVERRKQPYSNIP